MLMEANNKNIIIWIVAVIAMMSFLHVTASPSFSVDTLKNSEDAYRYDPKGKPDPFKTLVTEIKKDEKKKNLPLSPLQRFSTSEFSLMGVAWTDKERMAMVKSPEGKWYTIYRNTPIGLSGGRVVEILNDSVIVEEKKNDSYGKIHRERVILTLNRNGVNE